MNKRKRQIIRVIALVLVVMLVLGVFTALLSSLWFDKKPKVRL